MYPGIAIAQALEESGPTEILFIGTAYGLENRVLPGLPYRFERIWMRGLRRTLSPANLLFPLRLLVSVLQCGYHFVRFKPHVVIGTGGYVSGPALLAARLLRIPAVIQEQNSFPGLVNRLLGRFVDQVYLTYEASRAYFKGRDVVVTGNPVRGDFGRTDRKTARERLGLNQKHITLLIFGGSQGARAINEALLEALDTLLAQPDLQLLWLTGPADYERVQNAVQAYEPRVVVHAFLEDMASAYAAADLVLCRAGATTLAEITLCGLPAILVPYPYATADHQDFNARALEDAGAAVRLRQTELSGPALANIVTELLQQPEKRRAMAEAARKLARPQAAKEIAQRVRALIGL